MAAMTIRDVIERQGHFAHAGNPDDTVGFKVAAGDLEAGEAREPLGAY